MSAFRDFDAEIREVEGEPTRFKLGGEEFECVHPAPLGAILVLTKNSVAKGDDPMAQAEQAAVLWKFIPEEDHDRFDRALEKLSDLSIIQSLIEFILTEAVGRPTPGSSS